MTDFARLTIGTAGHVDHGKTSLVRALTGIDTDRWDEEKRRGMTIDLGFAHLDLPRGRRAAIVDVPGHERFLKNMLAGACGLDLVLFVVAADDGVMPQSREHLDILELLAIRSGLVVLTKVDLVDAELLDLATTDVRQALAGSFLAEAPLLPVSTTTGEGLPALVDAIERMVAASVPRSREAPARMAVDRAFVRPGFGTVVTGTMQAGRWREGDRVSVWPGDLEARIRGLQVHGEKVAEAFAGQRVALNLAGLERQEIASRGTVVGAPGSVQATTRLAAHVRLLPHGTTPLQHRDRIRLHLGTAEAIGRVVLLEGDTLAAGESAYAVIDLETPVAAATGERFVLRRYSPMMTIGGGRVLQPEVGRLRRRHSPTLQNLEAFATADWGEVLSARLQQSPGPIGRTTLLHDVPAPGEAVLQTLIADGSVIDLGGLGLAHRDNLESWQARILDALDSYLRAQGWRRGAPREVTTAATKFPSALADYLIDGLVRQGKVQPLGSLLTLPGRHPGYPANELADWTALEARIQKDGLVDRDDLGRDFPLLAARLADYIQDRSQSGELLRLSPEIAATSAAWARMVVLLRSALQAPFTAAQARDVWGISRRFAIPLLEYCDQQGVTRRQGDLRTLT